MTSGTLFLDEIGDMPPEAQTRLLRALQSGRIRRVGGRAGNRHRRAHHRRHQPQPHKTFREDLYYRLSMVEIAVPPLAEREGDLPLLVRHFTRRFSDLYRKPIAGWTRRSEIVMLRHNWPGNVRELENAVGHACMMAMGETIDVGDLPPYLWGGEGEGNSIAAAAVVGGAGPDMPGLEDQEKALLQQALEKCAGNRTAAARMLRISRDTMRYRMKKFGLG
jgi:two-component system, NtrC family, response regulator HydG